MGAQAQGAYRARQVIGHHAIVAILLGRA